MPNTSEAATGRFYFPSPVGQDAAGMSRKFDPAVAQQLAIDFAPERAARHTDPETSKAAARQAAKFRTSHAGRILLALQQHGPRTPKELEQIVGLSVVQIDRRLPELKKAKLARVVTLDDGADAVRNGCRVWSAIGG